jgi:8-oxo-dGTP pyrophosphatase MutT (NUDIX family)
VHSAVMSAGAAKSGEARLIANGARASRPSVKFFRLSQLRRLRGCEQVAAVCYRVRSSGIEFLLVRTGSGHWTFPKGSAEPGLTHAQAAALEAFEEAGVHGRMEEASFTRYIRRKGGRTRNSARSGERSAVKEIAIQAHLCEVSRLDPPQERNRNPTWFSADKAKRRLREDRTPDFGSELARVVDRAVTRIRRLRSEGLATKDRPQKDALQKVQFIVPTAAGRIKALRSG